MVKNVLEILPKEEVGSLTNTVGEIISQLTMWNIVNQLGKHNCPCVSVVNNLKDSNFFSHQMNRNCFDSILARRDCNCSTK